MNDIHNGEGPFMVRAAQVARMRGNRIFSCLAMIRDFNQMTSRPYLELGGFHAGDPMSVLVGAAHPNHRERKFAGGLMMTPANFTRFRAARNQ
jgi:hypothetical protein